MANSVYQINKGINKSIEFKGLKAQYIWYLGAGVVLLLVLFAFMYIAGLPPLVCVVIVAVVGAAVLMKVYAMSKKYGEHGLMKALARKQVPAVLKVRSRNVFLAGGKKGKRETKSKWDGKSAGEYAADNGN